MLIKSWNSEVTRCPHQVRSYSRSREHGSQLPKWVDSTYLTGIMCTWAEYLHRSFLKIIATQCSWARRWHQLLVVTSLERGSHRIRINPSKKSFKTTRFRSVRSTRNRIHRCQKSNQPLNLPIRSILRRFKVSWATGTLTTWTRVARAQVSNAKNIRSPKWQKAL